MFNQHDGTYSPLKLTWLCPTWNRPKCLRNLIAQFLAQDYPSERLELIILDDAGQYENQSGDDGHGGKRWQLISFKRPFATLGEKYNTLLALAHESDGVVVAEDDDLYLPKHSAACAYALRYDTATVCKPTNVLVEYGGRHIESDPGRFHASLAMKTDFLRDCGGWPISKRADFDLQMIAKLRTFGVFSCPQTHMLGSLNVAMDAPEGVRDTLVTFEPTYCFRWETTGHTHAQAYGRGPDDENYLARAREAAGPIEYVGKLFDSVG